MSVIFELWDTETANQIGTYDSEDDALAVVRNAVRTHGSDVLATIALGREDEDGDTEVIAVGSELVELATADLAARA